MEIEWVERSHRAAAAIAAGSSAFSYESLVGLLAQAYREGALAGLERGRDIALQSLRETHEQLSGEQS